VSPAGDESATLRFFENGVDRGSFTLAQLRARVPEETVSGFDPYYQRPKRWRALPLEPVLRLAFPEGDLTGKEFTLRALDGYTMPLSGARLLGKGGYLAFADADGAWEPIGVKHADPAPWYLVWKDQIDLTTHPRPWALASIAIEPFEAVFPLVVPHSKDARVQQGFAIFRQQCVKCHAINQQGGRVGPELNVPKNVTEYRDEAFLRAWIRNPFSFRVSVMPASPQLSEDELTAVLAYLASMKDSKIAVEAPH
jgi:mono/diheme cytochrome c family protein